MFPGYRRSQRHDGSPVRLIEFAFQAKNPARAPNVRASGTAALATSPPPNGPVGRSPAVANGTGSVAEERAAASHTTPSRVPDKSADSPGRAVYSRPASAAVAGKLQKQLLETLGLDAT